MYVQCSRVVVAVVKRKRGEKRERERERERERDPVGELRGTEKPLLCVLLLRLSPSTNNG